MDGGTSFHFVTDGIERALEQAKESTDGQDVRMVALSSASMWS
jgi:dihydrofolate reductase